MNITFETDNGNFTFDASEVTSLKPEENEHTLVALSWGDSLRVNEEFNRCFDRVMRADVN